MPFADEEVTAPHSVSIVVPVYTGEKSLSRLVDEIRPLVHGIRTPSGHQLRVVELILVHDHGPDLSEDVIRHLSSELSFIRPIWLSKNFGQHAATIAGMSSTCGDWIVTMDEDGQFNPIDIARMLDVAMNRAAQLVYAVPVNDPPHGILRNIASTAAKFIASRLLADVNIGRYSSFRLMLGEVGRSIAAYVGPGVYLDVALAWGFGSIELCPVDFRTEYARPSGYNLRKLLSHFWRLVITAGPRPLRVVSITGMAAAIAAIVVAVVLSIERLTGRITVPGWTSLAIIVLFLGGLNLIALGIIAEYVSAAVGMAMGKPLYLITTDPRLSPLGRETTQDTSIDRLSEQNRLSEQSGAFRTDEPR